MKVSVTASVAALAATASATEGRRCCADFAAEDSLRDKVFFPGSAVYDAQLKSYYSANAAQHACAGQAKIEYTYAEHLVMPRQAGNSLEKKRQLQKQALIDARPEFVARTGKTAVLSRPRRVLSLQWSGEAAGRWR
ncbi:hypothetical protein NLG97_g6876 [Lecanicillium saksenae]|uniref:Uncharacterized protein n=1 Tax=Lecanicillium saksenae TaxID=468837 RepID=A0ACC1QNE7_9HYPO|nr:hypothetical protein NLG97_g6876 [Lecanicillium saksenae]